MCRATKRARWLVGLLVVGLLLGSVSAEAFPDRPINMIVPWGVGGGGDRVGRVISSLLSQRLGVSVPVINVTGASGQVGLEKALSEPADGYNIIEITSDTYILFAGPHPRFKVSDFTPLAIVDRQPSGFFVREASPYKTWDDLARTAKSQPIQVAGSGFGTQSDVTVNYFDKVVGLKFVSVPFGKPGLRWDSLLGGHTDLLYAQFGDLTTYLANKQLRPVLAFAEHRLPSYPSIPTAEELGYHIDITHFRAFAVKHGTSEVLYNKLVSAMNAAAKTPKYKAMLQSEAALPDSYISGNDAQQYVQKWISGVHAQIVGTSK